MYKRTSDIIRQNNRGAICTILESWSGTLPEEKGLCPVWILTRKVELGVVPDPLEKEDLEVEAVLAPLKEETIKVESKKGKSREDKDDEGVQRTYQPYGTDPNPMFVRAGSLTQSELPKVTPPEKAPKATKVALSTISDWRCGNLSCYRLVTSRKCPLICPQCRRQSGFERVS